MIDYPWFRYIKRYIMKEYPFVIDVVPEPNYMEYTSLYFIRLIIDIDSMDTRHNDATKTTKLIPFLSYAATNGEVLEDSISKTLTRLSKGLPDNIKPDRRVSLGSFYNPKGW